MMMKTFPVLLATALLWLDVSFSKDVASDPLAAIVPAMEAEIEAGHTAGAVTLVMKDGKIVHHAAAGLADREKEIPMSKDAVFWIASMTKSISVTTIMTLVDEGKLSLDEPAATWMPAIGKMKLANGKPPARPVTLRDLMSHTSGLQFPPRKANDGAHSLRSYTEQLVKAPLSFEPGSDYEYGFGITVAGRIAEIVSGKSFEELMQERVLDPLGMDDTAFHPGDELRARIARTYKTGEDGKSLERSFNSFHTADAGERRMTEPSGGLFSTASDMAKFYQMILDGGVWEGKRIVSETAIAEMTTPHTAGDTELTYGLGWMCNRPDQMIVRGFSADAYGHGGAFATHGWVDPEREIVAVLMIQNVMVKGSREVRDAFHQVISKAYSK